MRVVIEANCVVKRHGDTSLFLSDEDKRKIRELALDPQIGARIIKSIAPSIYGSFLPVKYFHQLFLNHFRVYF